MEIKRQALNQLKNKIEPGKVVILYGPRRCGKTYLLKKLEKEWKNKEKVAYFNGDKIVVQKGLSGKNANKMINFIGKETTLAIIDEAQYIPNVGYNLKILVDEFPKLKIIASGSSSFDLAQIVGEPLTGRKKTILLYPVWAQELIDTKDMVFYKELFEERLIYGSYPEIFQKKSLNTKKEYLLDLVDSYLLKDILNLQQLKHSKKLVDLLTLIAFQIGNEVSLNELGNNLDLHKDTVARYLDLLEKSFILINIRGFSRNLRKEVYKNSRWYFLDNGVRNAVINGFNSLEIRNDIGMLWENYLVSERLKKQEYKNIYANNFFWRTWDQKEVDWIEEREGKLYGYEFKWGDKKVKAPKDWIETYDNARFKVINRENYLDFIS